MSRETTPVSGCTCAVVLDLTVLPPAVTDRGAGTGRRRCAIVLPLHLVHGFHHEPELVDELTLERLRQRVQLVQEPVDGDLVVVELPGGDLLLDPGAEKVGR